MSKQEKSGFIPLGQDLVEIPLADLGSVEIYSDSLIILEKIQSNNNDPAIPDRITELNSQESTEHFYLNHKQAIELKIPIASVSGSRNEIIFIEQYSKSREVIQLKGVVQYGIAVRWIVSIEEMDGKANIESMPMVAASAQFGYIRARAKFEVIGISSRKVTDFIPAVSELDVKTFVTFTNALNAIKSIIWDEDTQITPTSLAALGQYKVD